MRIKALQMFVELSQAESIRQLARAHGVKPSVISRQIESLEYHFRCDLFERNFDGVKLTEAGRLLVDQARTILADVRTARALIDDLRGLQRGDVMIFTSAAPAAGLLAPMIAKVCEEYPGLRFGIQTASGAEVINAVVDGQADLGFTIFSPETSKVDVRCTRQLSQQVIMAPQHPFASFDSITYSQLASISLALPEPNFGARRLLNRVGADLQLTFQPVFETSSLAMLKELGMQGAAALVLPAVCCRREIEMGLLKAVPIEGEPSIDTTLDLCCAKDRPLSFAARTVLNAIRDAMSSL